MTSLKFLRLPDSKLETPYVVSYKAENFERFVGQHASSDELLPMQIFQVDVSNRRSAGTAVARYYLQNHLPPTLACG